MTLQIEQRAIGALIPYARNARTHSDAQIAQIAVSVGVPQEVADTFVDGEFVDWVHAATEQASIDGVTGTPSVMVDRVLLDSKQIPYVQPGVLGTYLDSVAGN